MTSCDIPIYLPRVSPNVAHRLLIFTLIVGANGGMRACVLCGPEPSLTDVQEKLVERWVAAEYFYSSLSGKRPHLGYTRGITPKRVTSAGVHISECFCGKR